MTSLQFPNMFNSAKTNVVLDHDATLSNLKLLLASYKNSLYGDPFYGTNLNAIIYEQNFGIVADLIVDDIYTNIITFLPQLFIKRTDITITHDGTNVYANIKAINKIDYTTDLFNINLTNV